MTELTAREREALLESARKIRTYKLMQADGYKRLTKKAVDDRTKQLLAEISADELSDARSWAKRIEWLADGEKKPSRAAFLKQRVSLMMGILGIEVTIQTAV